MAARFAAIAASRPPESDDPKTSAVAASKAVDDPSAVPATAAAARSQSDGAGAGAAGAGAAGAAAPVSCARSAAASSPRRVRGP